MDNGEFSDYWDCWPNQLERFANLVAAAEREACAQVCENYTDKDMGAYVDHEAHGHECATLIRARGEK